MKLALKYRTNRPQVVHEVFDDEVVLINFDSGKYFSFNHVGAAIWESIEEQRSIESILEILLSRFSGSRDRIESSLAAFIRQLEDAGLIVPAETSQKPVTEPAGAESRLNSAADLEAFEAPELHQYDDMQELLLLDPIHEVDESGWPNKNQDPTGG